MSNFDSELQWFAPLLSENKTAIISLPEEELDSDIATLKKQQSTISNSDANGNTNLAKAETEIQLENLLSQLLKYGVLIASAVVLIGSILYLISHGNERPEYQFFKGEPSEFRSPIGVIKAAYSGNSGGIIQLGLLLLIATPILRVIVSLLTFSRQRDYKYIIITFLVLSALIYSMIGAYY